VELSLRHAQLQQRIPHAVGDGDRLRGEFHHGQHPDKIANGTTPAPTSKSTLRPVGSMPLSDAEAAARVRPFSYEHKPGNTVANHTRPTSSQLTYYYGANYWGACEWRRDRVTGDFTGTTDEIIQWGAHKWALDEDVLRAVAHKESTWRQWFHGDIYSGHSYGTMQVKASVHLRTRQIPPWC
jgi:hypothetical protein